MNRLKSTHLGITMKHNMNFLASKRRNLAGFTLIELLIGMSILGVILVAASGLLQGNQKLTNDAQTRSNALGDARGAISRMTDTISQAAYIYPADSTISLTGIAGNVSSGNVITGKKGVAVLISDGAVIPKYQGVIYYLADRSHSQFASDLPQLPADRVAQHVLVEAKTIGTIEWTAKTLPDLNWVVDASEGVLVDGIDVTMPETDLMTDRVFAPESGSDGSVFQKGLEGASPKPELNTKEALITTIGYSIGIRVATNGKSLADSGTTVLRGLANSRNVPRRSSP
jgi:prepilin-type N-terminal cleavage/methylation domain-containing protein